MADNSLQSLLQWMADPGSDPLQGWDAIAALGRGKLNQLLAQAWVAGMRSDSYLPPVSDEVMLVEGRFKERFHALTLDVPRLSFESPDHGPVSARLSMALVSGVDTAMKRSGEVWEVYRVSEMTPLLGAQLYLDLHLDQVPGTVGEQGQVVLDLTQGDNFHLTFTDADEQQRLGGELFRRRFNELPAGQRRFVLGAILPGGQTVLRPQSFALCAQHCDGSPDEGAILVLMRMPGSPAAAPLPTGYRYLIPDDPLAGYSASLLLQRQRVLAGALLHMLGGLLGDAPFNYEYTAQGQLRSATSTAGALVVPGAEYLVPVLPDAGGEPLSVRVSMSEMVISADSRQALRVTFEADKAVISWNAQGQVVGTVTLGQAALPMRQFCTLQLEAEYQLSGPDPELRRTRWNVDSQMDWLPAPVDSAAQDVDLRILLLAWAVICTVVASKTAEDGVKPRIEAHLSQSLPPEPAVDAFIRDSIDLNFAHAIKPDTLRLPRDLGAFGRINPQRGSFVIAPLQPVLKAGASQLFVTNPPLLLPRWSVEHLDAEAGDDGDIGSIETKGLYRAPAAETISGRFIRLKVTATDLLSGYHSSALVTVVRKGLVINPLIQTCEAGGQVSCTLAQVGRDTLRWSIRNPQAGRSGTLESRGTECLYRATDEAQVGNTCVLDEIQVRNEHNGETVSVYVLVPPPASPVSLQVASGPAPGSIQLQAFTGATPLPNPEWRLPLGGPGSLDAAGVYTADFDPVSGDSFVLVMAKGSRLGREVEGHLILPLPLQPSGA